MIVKFGDVAQITGWPDPHSNIKGPVHLMYIGAVRSRFLDLAGLVVLDGYVRIGGKMLRPGEMGTVKHSDVRKWITHDPST